jgi:putative ATP-dependent endonuclease of OLD family
MKITSLKINNFRGVKSAELQLDGHTLFVGKNNVGKSTICEALDLLLGPDRLNRSSPVDEYDFYNGIYLDEDNVPVEIYIEAVLIDLSDNAKTTFGGHIEFWHSVEKRVLGDGEIDTVDTENIEPCLRLKLKAKYDFEEDEFIANTYYARSPGESDDGELQEVYKSQKREIGFLYLRALRTGSRALSLEKGSLLDLLLRVGRMRPKLWEDTRKKLMEMEIDESIGLLRPVLDNIEARVNQYVSIEASDRPIKLFVSQLTREHLRKTVSFFMSTSPDQNPVPFQELGTGTLNTLVFALLSAIAELKKENVIFAMEEPEIAVSPHTQRRIVKYLLESTAQSFVTTHSPYVIEQFSPEQIKILRRDENATLTTTAVSLTSGLKPKLFKRKLRPSIAEAILGKAVVIGEGLVEFEVLKAAVDVMETEDESLYPLDLSGITFFDSDGDGNLSEYGAFFKSLGLNTYAFYDNKNRTPAEIISINDVFDINHKTNFDDIEKLLAAELPVEVLWIYLQELNANSLLPHDMTIPTITPTDAEVRTMSQTALISKKGDGRCADVIRRCTKQQLPESVSGFLQQVYDRHAAPSPVDPIEIPNEEEIDIT